MSKVSDGGMEYLSSLGRPATKRELAKVAFPAVEWDDNPQTTKEPVSCRSEDIMTMGLIDGIIAQCRILRDRQMDGPATQEAIKDILRDEDVKWLLSPERLEIQ